MGGWFGVLSECSLSGKNGRRRKERERKKREGLSSILQRREVLLYQVTPPFYRVCVVVKIQKSRGKKKEEKLAVYSGMYKNGTGN